MLRNFLILLVVTCFSMACSSNEVVIDNPTQEPLTVIFDRNQEVTVAPNSVEKINLRAGQHRLTYNGEDTVIRLDDKRHYLINPSRADYILRELTYTAEQKDSRPSYDPGYRLPMDTISILGIKMYGHFKVIKRQYVIARSWSFGLDEEFPESISTKNDGNQKLIGMLNMSYNTSYRVKIYRKKDLLSEALDEAAQQEEEDISKSQPSAN